MALARPKSLSARPTLLPPSAENAPVVEMRLADRCVLFVHCVAHNSEQAPPEHPFPEVSSELAALEGNREHLETVLARLPVLL